MRTIPETIHTTCAPLNEAWERYAGDLVGQCGLCVQDDDKALNWDAFLSRSVPLVRQPGYVGYPSDVPDLAPLRERGITLRDLADLWQIDALRDHLTHRDENSGEPAAAHCSLLLASGGPAGQMLCQAFRALPKSSSHWSVRALLQNAASLAETDYSFRKWIEREVRMLGDDEFPPRDFRRTVVVTEPNGVAQRSLEDALVGVMGRVFHRASPPVAAHMLCDWQLGLWRDEQTDVFDLYPFDSHHRHFVNACSDIPTGAVEFVGWWHAQPGCAQMPPRLASACMACRVQAGPLPE